MLKKNAAARSQGLAAARRPMGSAALRRACFARAAPHSASFSLLLFLNVSNVRVHLSEVPLFERRQANTSTEEVNKEPGKLMQRFESL